MRWALIAGVAVTAVLAVMAHGAGQPRSTSARAVAGIPSTAIQPSSDLAVERVKGGAGGTYVVPQGIHKIQHVIVIMQENRSFDSYFGTFPGANGIAMVNGQPKACVPNPDGPCVSPYHDTADVNGGGPHANPNAIGDIDGGKMDGFVIQRDNATSTCTNPDDPACAKGEPDVMGYHTDAEIPNYWTYAEDFALDDRMFEPVSSWSLPDHLYMVSGWSAKCTDSDPSSCRTSLGAYPGPQFNKAVQQEESTGSSSINLAWTDITYLLDKDNVSWAYYVQAGTQPDCDDSAAETCSAVPQSAQTPGIWNPLPLFNDVQEDGQLANVQDLSNYFTAAKNGTLPAVTWITPSESDSEHPPSSVHQGQAYTTALINAAMEGPDWDSTAIFLSWDDWGGFYDHVVPPVIDHAGYGLRVPSITISPYAKQGYIDKQTLSHDAFLKFIEDDFLGGARLDPTTDGRPDPRPDVREDEAKLGNLADDFDFSQQPRAPVLLPTNPPTDSPSIPGYFVHRGPCVGCTTLPGGSSTSVSTHRTL